MSVYIALLRGINVSGQKSILMEDLKKLFEDAGFAKVRTYIQSGNVLFESKKKGDAALARFIEKKIEVKYGFDVTVVIRTVDEIEKILATNPFKKPKGEKVYVCMAEEMPSAEAAKQLAKSDEYKLIGGEVFILPKGGFGKTLFNNNWFEKKLGVRATTRNTDTLEKLLALGRA